MAGWEYKVMPAPTKGLKGKGVKGAEGRFANALETLMNEMALEGWEFQRAETLPSVERVGLTGSATEWRNLLVFRRAVPAKKEELTPELLPAPSAAPAVAPATTATASSDAPFQAAEETLPANTDEEFVPGEGATQMLPDNGVEGTSDVAGMTASLQKLASRRNGSEIAD